MENLFRRIPHVNHPAWGAFRDDMKRRIETVGRDRCSRLDPADIKNAWYAFRNGWDIAARKFEQQHKTLIGFMENLEVSDSCVGACPACESNLINRDLVKKEISKIT